MRELTRVDTIYETLRDRICLGQYNRGDIFHEANLGQEFKVSRTPIRQALQRLAFEKLATVRAGVGTVVEGFPDETVSKYLELHARMLLAAAELDVVAARDDDEELIVSLQVRASRLSSDAEPVRFWALLKAVHELCNHHLGDDLVLYMNDLLFYRSASGLMRAVRANPAGAVEIIGKNISNIVKPLEKSDYPGFFTAHSKSMERYKRLL